MPRTVMPPRPKFIPAPGVVGVEMIYSHLGVIMENVYHVLDTSGAGEPDEARLNAICDVFNGWETVSAKGGRSNQCRLTLIRARQLGVKDGVVVEKAPVGDVTGFGTAPAAPGNVTAAVKWSTARGGRSFRGRTFHIGITEDHHVGNQLLPVFQTGLQAGYAALITAVSATAGLKLAVLSFATNNTWRDAGLATPITSCSVDVNLDSQRRRLTGRGS